MDIRDCYGEEERLEALRKGRKPSPYDTMKPSQVFNGAPEKQVLNTGFVGTPKERKKFTVNKRELPQNTKRGFPR